MKSQSENTLEVLYTKLNELKNRKNNLEEENEKLKVDKDKLEMDYIIKIEKTEKMKEENNKREEELNLENRELMEELIKLDRIISQKKSEMNIWLNYLINKKLIKKNFLFEKGYFIIIKK